MRILAVLLATLLLGSSLQAQGWIEPFPGHLGGVVKLRTAVSVRVDDRVAVVEVEEWFENRGPGLGEGDYLYPLPGEAVFSNFSLFQGDQELQGETMDAKRARKIYEDIVRRKKDPALIELAGHGLVRARVFPFNPGETRRIVLRYTQVMPRAGDALQFQYVAGGRTERGTATGDRSGRRVVAPRSPISFRLVVERGEAFRDPFSPTHDVAVARDGRRLTVRVLDELRGDLALFLPFEREVVGLALATHRSGREDGYFMLTLSPGTVTTTVLPRDITAVVDVSGSMSGEKIEQAKSALRQLLRSLNSGDRFRLIAFSSRVSTYRPGWTEATDDRLRRAERWIDELDANGGTNIEGALSEAFAVRSGNERIPIVIFLTDGLPSVGEENPERIAQQAERARDDTRVFAFGVGYDVNTYLLDRLSDAGRGTTQYVRPGEDVEAAVGHLSAKIRHPVLADLEIGDVPVDISDVYPVRLPDLFAGEELVVFGRYRIGARDRTGRVTIAGRRGERTEHFAAEARFPRHAPHNDYIPRLWAARKIGWLSQTLKRDGPNRELEEEIRETALRFGLLSEYTSYLVREPEQTVADATPGGRMQARMLQAPSEAHGAIAVETAKLRQAQRTVRTNKEADRLADELLRVRRDVQSRHVAGRLFEERAGRWTDIAHTESAAVVEIEAYSNAYFRLLQSLPELEPYLRVFEHVLISGKRVSLNISETGVTELSDKRLERLVESFRGR